VKLTAKQQRFCDEYLIDLNATQAAIRAGYSRKTARQTAAENMTKPVIKEYIENRLEELQSEKVADQQEIMETLTRLLRRESKAVETVVVKKAETIEVTTASGKTSEKVVYNEYASMVELPTANSDVNRAAELLGKRYAMWTDKQHVEGEMGVVIVDDVDDEED
jgi:phage terminase small subunit